MTSTTSLLSSGAQFALDVWRLALGLRPSKPFLVGLTLNTVCNLRCSYCFIGREVEHFPEGFSKPGLSGEEVKQILRNIRRDTGFLILTGGEPFLHREFKEILRYAKEELRFVNISIATNGMFLRKKKDCLQYIDRLGISYDFTRAREYPKEMKKMLEDLVELRNEGILPPVHFTMTIVTSEDPSPFPEFATYCKKHRFRIWIQPEREHGNFTNWSWFAELLNGLQRNYGADLFLNDIDLVQRFALSEQHRRCLPELRIHIKEDGTLAYPCHRLEHLHTGGSALTSSPTELWRRAEKEHGRFPNELCRNCGFTCYFETTGLYKRPILFLRKALSHLTSQEGTPGPGDGAV